MTPEKLQRAIELRNIIVSRKIHLKGLAHPDTLPKLKRQLYEHFGGDVPKELLDKFDPIYHEAVNVVRDALSVFEKEMEEL